MLICLSFFWWWFFGGETKDDKKIPETPKVIEQSTPKKNLEDNDQDYLLNAGFVPLLPAIPAPNSNWQFFTDTQDKGTVKNLGNFTGKPTILHFWATWCAPCRKELPHFDQFVGKFSKEFNIVTLSVGKERSTDIWNFYKENSIQNLNVAIDELGNLGKSLNIRSIPCTVFLNSKGMIIGYFVGTLDWSDNKLIEALKKIL
jgi:thiol-disulfide isomerase/thioredoxin